MTDQEIIDAIDAEIQKTEVDSKSGSEDFYFECMSRIAGLRFARELIERRTKEAKA